MDSRLRRYNENFMDKYPTDDSSDDDSENSKTKPCKEQCKNLKRHNIDKPISEDQTTGNNENFLLKLIKRENTGHFSGNFRNKSNQKAFNSVPSRLSFCLKDIVPYCYLQGHMFMGLTVCGQFLVSYKVCYDESSFVSNYNFSTYYKYTLYFWIYRPHEPLAKYYRVCMFDDHGVDNLKAVTMTQWHSNPRILVVHGASEYENEDSYVTIFRVPKLGCLDCKELRDTDDLRCDALCIKCNLTIHSKYSTTESDPDFNPHINLICPERIVVIANGFIHMLNVDLEVQKVHHHHQHNQNSPQQNQTANLFGSPQPNQNKDEKWLTVISPNHNETTNSNTLTDTPSFSLGTQRTIAPSLSPPNDTYNCDNKNNIVARIIADFSDYESDSQTFSEKSHEKIAAKNYDEVIFTCSMSSPSNSPNSAQGNVGSSSSGYSANAKPLTSPTVSQSSKVSLLNHSGKKNHRIVTKSYRNGVTTIDLQGVSSSSNSTSSEKAASAYEFSEDTEKCEKIGTFRKKRLADKKYEFSEDNSENIIPFTKSRFSSTLKSRIHRPLSSSHHSTGTGTVYLSALSSQTFETTSHLHRASPSQGFRSPCGSPVGGNGNVASSSGISNITSLSSVNNRLIRSPIKNQQQIFNHKSPPQAMSPNYNYQFAGPQISTAIKPLSTLSPIQISAAKRNHFEIGNISPTINPFLSPRRDDTKVFEMPLEGILESHEKPICTKKFRRRYVEEDDAVSVITSEEDDCISPGYHTSLPMEVHGSCYSDMKMISQSSYQQLRATTVVITQHSFDLETFTYYVISNLCQKNNKTYDVFYDWACELISVCPNSNELSCMLMAHFTARDQLPASLKKCINCSRNIDCVFHRKQFECRILFSWNMESGDWEVLDYGQLNEIATKSGNGHGCLSKIAKSIALDIAGNLKKMHNFSFNLRVLDSNLDKSKNSLTDLDNMIEFYRKKPKLSRINCNNNNSDDDDEDSDNVLDY